MPHRPIVPRSLRLAAGLALLLPAPLAAQDAALPAAESLVAAHVQAIGGEQAVRRHASYRMTGTFELAAAGISGQIEMVAAAPDRNAIRLTIPGLGEIRSGFDGTHAWEMSPVTGSRLLEGEELERIAADADFYGGMLRNQDAIVDRRTVERTSMGGTPCYLVRVTWQTGRESHECYAVDGGLLVATRSNHVSPMGTMEVTQLMGDYREFGGVRHPTTMRQQMMGAEQVLRISSIEYDVVDDGAFALPAAIRTLVDRKGGATPPDRR